jgi:hypothetical protein
MTKEQIYKLEQALELIQDSIGYEKISRPKIISTWLRVAGNYCREIASEIAEVKD